MTDVTLVHDYELKRQAVYKTPRYALTFGATDTQKSFTLQANGVTHLIVLEIPNWTNTVNTTLTIENEDGIEIYNSGAKAQNQSVKLAVQRPLHGVNTVKVSLDGQPGGTGGTVHVTMYVI